MTYNFSRTCVFAAVFVTAGGYGANVASAERGTLACDTYAASEFDPQRRAPSVDFGKIDARLAVPACEAAVRQFPDDMRLRVQLGRAYEKANNFTSAVEQYRKAAAEGFALAQSNLGTMYFYGSGVPKDLEQAVTWYRKAADQGLAIAQKNLGNMYQNGSGVPKDLEQAAAWYRKAADQGLALAQNQLGWMYQNGWGVPKDLEQAVAWYRKAADQGLAIAQNNLGNIYLNGEGVPADLKVAIEWFTKAAAQGLRDAQNNLRLAQHVASMSVTEMKALQQRLADGGCYQGAIDGQLSPALQDAIKACPSQDPILRIETGMHVVAISRIGVDRACKIAATGSDDKTVRVWSLPDGRLLRTLRVPIGAGNGGMIYATAMSPDGRWIAAGGWDARREIRNEHFVYIFDATTGEVVARAGPFGNVILHLAFSPDGRWLAATSAAGVGLKVIDAQTWQIVAQDGAYSGESYGAAFAPDGRLYTVAYDGKLRQYGPGPAFKKEREVATQGGKQPSHVAVDPRGQLVALVFNDAMKLDVYDAATLRFRFAVHDIWARSPGAATARASLPAVTHC